MSTTPDSSKPDFGKPDFGKRDAEESEPGRPGYAEALAELEAILAELEHDNVDVDRLAGQVHRAAELIRLCRERIGNARMQIENVVTELGT